MAIPRGPSRPHPVPRRPGRVGFVLAAVGTGLVAALVGCTAGFAVSSSGPTATPTTTFTGAPAPAVTVTVTPPASTTTADPELVVVTPPAQTVTPPAVTVTR